MIYPFLLLPRFPPYFLLSGKFLNTTSVKCCPYIIHGVVFSLIPVFRLIYSAFIPSLFFLPHLQAPVNGSGRTYTTSHKKKLWSSLELSNTLTVENVTGNYTGMYTCTASSGKMVKTASASLVVFGRYT